MVKIGSPAQDRRTQLSALGESYTSEFPLVSQIVEPVDVVLTSELNVFLRSKLDTSECSTLYSRLLRCGLRSHHMAQITREQTQQR